MAGGAMGAVRPGGAERRHGGRVARSVLRHARAAEVHAHRSGGGAGDRRCGQAAGDGRTLGRLHPARCLGWRRGAGDLPRRCRDGRSVRCAAPAAGADAGRGICRQCLADRCRARGVSPDRLCRAADLFARIGGGAVSVRQRPPGAGQAAGGRVARGLCRFPEPRPASGGGAVHRLSIRSWWM